MKKKETRIEKLERAVRYLALNHQRYLTKQGKNGGPDITQEAVDNFWIERVNEILKT